jgi:hypothetical protein
MKRVWVGVLAGALLSGCASTPAPVMSEADYTALAYAWNTAERCIASGNIDPAVAAYGKKRMQQKVAGYSHDPGYLNKRIKEVWEERPDAPVENCRILEAEFAGLRDEYDRNVRNSQPTNSGQYTTCYSGMIGTNCISY